MAKHGKAATLVLAILPALATAQSAPAGPASQPHPAAPAATRPAVQPPGARWFVPNENFYKAGAKPQPGTTAPANMPGANVPGRPALITRTAPATVIQQQPPVMPQPMRPAAAPVPAMQSPQLPQAQPVVINSSGAPAVTAADGRAAVDYAYGKLTVVAENAPLSLVFKLIAAKTGAMVDLAPELQNEPVMAHLGPASVSDVLTGLLDSPRIDYIVFGTGDQPGSLQRIVVRTRRSFGRVAMAAVRPQQPVDPESAAGQNPNAAGAPVMTPQQQQSMENWQKVREQMREEEIKQQAEEREREKTQPPEQPVAQNTPEPEPQQQDNPPQR